jgi:hypothetical protein
VDNLKKRMDNLIKRGKSNGGGGSIKEGKIEKGHKGGGAPPKLVLPKPTAAPKAGPVSKPEDKN